MIERELKRTFRGIAFHRVDIDEIDLSDREGSQLVGKALEHNLAEVLYKVTLTHAQSVEVKHRIIKMLTPKEYNVYKPSEEESELRKINGRVDSAWRDVIDTNLALPTNLRGRHS